MTSEAPATEQPDRQVGRQLDTQLGKQVGKPSPLQPIAHWLLRPFIAYIGYYVRRHFQALYLLDAAKLQTLEDWPILVCLNHPSWWDPLFALYLSHYFFPTREHYGPIASEGLSKYQFFGKLGFFGINPKTRAGAARFLQVGRAVLSRSDAALWVTAQGQFTDVRVRPMQLQPGVAHLAHTVGRFAMVPIALEYAFWNDRKPNVFAAVGEPLLIERGSANPTAEWLGTFSKALEETQSLLSMRIMQRDPAAFYSVFQTASGVGGIYDLWRAFRSIAGGRMPHAKSRTSLP